MLIAAGFTCMASSSRLATMGARLAIFVAGTVLVIVSLTVPVRIPVSSGVGDALDILALLALALTTCRALFARPEAERKPEGRQDRGDAYSPKEIRVPLSGGPKISSRGRPG